MLKKIVALFMILIFILTGCDPNDGKRPYDYHNTEWTSEEPYFKLTVDKDGEEYWEMEIDGEVQEVEAGFFLVQECSFGL